jgi:hypothetical protein
MDEIRSQGVKQNQKIFTEMKKVRLTETISVRVTKETKEALIVIPNYQNLVRGMVVRWVKRNK